MNLLTEAKARIYSISFLQQLQQGAFPPWESPLLLTFCFLLQWRMGFFPCRSTGDTVIPHQLFDPPVSWVLTGCGGELLGADSSVGTGKLQILPVQGSVEVSLQENKSNPPPAGSGEGKI